MNDRGIDASFGAGGGAGMGSGGAGGGTVMDAATWDSSPPADDACSSCDCNCYQGGSCEGGADADACPCDAAAPDGDAESDVEEDVVAD